MIATQQYTMTTPNKIALITGITGQDAAYRAEILGLV